MLGACTIMAKRKRAKRSNADLRQKLKDQLRLLQNACNSYDSSLEAIGKHIALSLRVLLHHHGQSRSLLEQLSLRNIRFLDTAGPLDLDNLISEHPFLILKITSGEGSYIPRVLGPTNPQHAERKIRFVDWWNNPVLKDLNGNIFNRREPILNVADTDGGAHVDPDLDEAYLELSRNNSIGWTFTKENIERAFLGRPELACMRQIAYEVLTTLKEKFPKLFE